MAVNTAARNVYPNTKASPYGNWTSGGQAILWEFGWPSGKTLYQQQTSEFNSGAMALVYTM